MKRKENNFMKVSKIIRCLLVVSLFIVIESLFAGSVLGDSKEYNDFLRYINKERYDYGNVLILGVDAKSERALELAKKYHFDKVIPVSREGGSSVEDWARASLSKLGISTATLKELNGKSIENLFASSWGSNEGINAISDGRIKKVKNLHLMGSPYSALFSSLNESINRGGINKVYFHINEGDDITKLRHLPSGLGGGFNPRIEFHFYTTKRNSIDTVYVKPKIKIPIFNVELGFDQYIHYNSPETGHGIESYVTNMSFALNRDPEHSPFRNSIPPFYTVPSYWTYRSPAQPPGKTMTEAQMITGMTYGKNRALIVGNDPAADLMYKNMVNKLGPDNVHRIQDPFLSNNQLQLEARKFGADVILGVKERRPLMGVTVRVSSEIVEEMPKWRSDQDTGMQFPDHYMRPPPVMPIMPNDIGGVMLQGVAKVSDSTGVGTQLSGGTFSLIFQNGNAEIDIERLRKFVTALWAVYFSREGPGISIDPIAPGVDKHLVRYIGQKVINSDLGRVMRETDYIMKKWAVGTERPDIPGFKNPDDIAARRGVMYVGAPSRFWFVPEDMRFKKTGNALIFDDGRMTVKTEYLFKGTGRRADPANEKFAEEFTKRYNEIAEKYPVYKELFEYAKLVSLAKYLKEKGIPMLWFLLANKDMVITEDSPGTVDALAKKSDYFEYIHIEGGVDLAVKPSDINYVIDKETVQALNKAFELYGPSLARGSSVLPSESITIDAGGGDLTLTSSQTLTLSSSTSTGDRYQTDLALRFGKEPGLEVIRYYDPEYEGPPTFGKGWHLMIPYQVEPYGEARVEFGGAIGPKRMVVKNLLTGREEVLTFSTDRYSIAGYVPDDLETSNIVGLFLLSDVSYRLADKLGNEFQFDQGGHLTEMIFSEEYYVKFNYGYEEVKRDEFTTLPYRMEMVGSEYEEFLNVGLPKNMKVIDLKDGHKEVLVFNRYDAGYIPVNKEQSRYTIIALMTDGSFVLKDKEGKEISFDPGGRFDRIRAWVVKGLSYGDYRVRFDYEVNNGEFRIKDAHVMRKDKTTALYAVRYKYGLDGRLNKVITPTGQEIEINYDKERVMVVMR